jgi:hypothetical protein
MSRQWEVGQRVRVGGRCRLRHCAPGTTGVLLGGPHRTPGGELGYLVQLDEGGPKRVVLLFDHEVEADV